MVGQTVPDGVSKVMIEVCFLSHVSEIDNEYKMIVHQFLTLNTEEVT